jgi:hypothetical protein
VNNEEDKALALTPEERARKSELIERKIQCVASPEELAELLELKRKTSVWLNRVAPLPLDAMRAQAGKPTTNGGRNT